MTAAIHVCPLSRLGTVLVASNASSVVTLLAKPCPTLPSFEGLRHCAIDVSDIAAPRAGYILAGEEHVAALLDFVRDWDRRAPLIVHCHAGVSRSTAAAYAAVCALMPEADEGVLAARLRAASPSATPNPRLVALADAALHRSGRMVEAIRAIGRGRDCFEGDVFSLDVTPRGQIPAYQV